MAIELKIPTVGESISEVQISEWLKAEGDAVNKDESVAVIDSEKTTFELPAPESGRLVKILHQAGEIVRIGDAVAQIEPGAAAPTEKKTKTAEKQPAPEGRGSSDFGTKRDTAKPAERQPAQAKESAEAEPEHADGKVKTEQVRITPPSTAKTKREPTIEMRAAPEPARKKQGPSRLVPDGEVAQAVKPEQPEPEDSGQAKVECPENEPVTPLAPAAEAKRQKEPTPNPSREGSGEEEEIVPMTMLRRTIARRLVEAQQTMAMLTTFNEVDMSAVQSLRRQHQEAFQKRYGIKLGLMSFFVKAAIDALKQFPQLNAEVRGSDIVYRNYFDIGIAIAAERGLVVPVLRRAERLSFAEVEKAIAEFTQRARENELKPEHLEGGTFTITNGGVFGSLLSTPIINPPQSGILGLHSVEDRPVAREGSVVVRPMMYLALTYDHRIVDGREAVWFLRRVKEAIEDPARMLVEV